MNTVGVYPGSFDPPTLGHIDVIERASKLFDKVIVAIGTNSTKMPLMSVDSRVEALTESSKHLKNVRVDSFTGLLVDYVRSVDGRSIIRGLRAISDFEYEFQMAMVNRKLTSDIETIFFMTSWEYSYLSSSIVREVALLGGDYRKMVPPAVAAILKATLPKRV